ncbi:MAG: hypothetical protein ACOYBS_06335, partial [Flavobacterium sp.]
CSLGKATMEGNGYRIFVDILYSSGKFYTCCVRDGSGILCFFSLKKQRYSGQPDPKGHAINNLISFEYRVFDVIFVYY